MGSLGQRERMGPNVFALLGGGSEQVEREVARIPAESIPFCLLSIKTIAAP